MSDFQITITFGRMRRVFIVESARGAVTVGASVARSIAGRLGVSPLALNISVTRV